MIAQPQVSHHCTPAEYLEQELAADLRHEYINGDIVPMTGGTPDHNQILLNLAGALNLRLADQPYRVFAADQRLWIPSAKIYTYPDIMVVQGKLAYQTGRRDTITNPMLIVEVLSNSTSNYDRGGKFAAYRSIPSFVEYILVDQYSAHGEHHVKTGPKQWLLQEYDGLDTSLTLSNLEFTILLRDLYNKVQLESDAPGLEAEDKP
ncbi:Uma2 family endonuclease [Leptolyngbya sp. PCC 6406]|uniref:Uma2 family endonuclease n=1 Tax=Leptolyngbya sp. PCC 6406 TaxID=1173264 RepID=UPI0002ABCEF3|nr:Uma2 family endonuclease [Leptolyngbya sp. PCC 6406]